MINRLVNVIAVLNTGASLLFKAVTGKIDFEAEANPDDMDPGVLLLAHSEESEQEGTTTICVHINPDITPMELGAVSGAIGRKVAAMAYVEEGVTRIADFLGEQGDKG